MVVFANKINLHLEVPFSLSARPPPPPPRLAVHRFCRQGLYPNTSIARQYFDDNHVPWSMNFPDYHPPFYTKSQSTPEADPETIQSDMMWNEFDTHYNVDRRTANPSGRYLIDAHGYPLNPLGRTGLVGRGQLPRWAVNYQTHLVIMLGTNELDQGREIFEYLIERPLDDDSCRLLSTWTTGTHMEAIKKTLRTYLMSIYHLWNGNENLNENELDAITEHLTFVSTAYIGKVSSIVILVFALIVSIHGLDDARNTDNAWLETSVCCYIQTDLHPTISSNRQIDLKRLFPRRTSNSQMKYCWSRLNQHSTLLESEREVVQLISQRYHAAW